MPVVKKQPSKSRMILGGIILIVGFCSPALIPLVIASTFSAPVKSVVSGLLAFGIPEVFMLLAVGIMGKEGFHYLKRIFSILLRHYGPPDEVSKTRYRIGLIMFILPLIISIIAPYVGHKFDSFQNNQITIMLTLHVMLGLSLFVLGGDFWDKLQGLFTYKAKIKFDSVASKHINHSNEK